MYCSSKYCSSSILYHSNWGTVERESLTGKFSCFWHFPAGPSKCNPSNFSGITAFGSKQWPSIKIFLSNILKSQCPSISSYCMTQNLGGLLPISILADKTFGELSVLHTKIAMITVLADKTLTDWSQIAKSANVLPPKSCAIQYTVLFVWVCSSVVIYWVLSNNCWSSKMLTQAKVSPVKFQVCRSRANNTKIGNLCICKITFLLWLAFWKVSTSPKVGEVSKKQKNIRQNILSYVVPNCLCFYSHSCAEGLWVLVF